MTPPIIRHSLKSAVLLAIFAVFGTALLSATHYATRERIAESEKQAELALIGQILPHDSYDNDILREARELPPAIELGNRDTTPLYLATQGGQPVAAVFEAIAPDGYAGKIKLLIVLKVSGEISGVRVLSHRETPGLGDYVEIARDAWITRFNGLSLAKLMPDDWKVKKDGGKFAHRSGATITPRAIVKAVHKALLYAQANPARFFPNQEKSK